ncbi:MAG: NAD(P)/FAD-dependent oxidoreductase [Clostridia bacterium]|nr:NAD(P)/FAD-dependent oxidoreductase [Clostridia bacterium]MDD4571998.1 NAD(P)/FAD-dependent oxidoreductase [Clostridia bacterium]
MVFYEIAVIGGGASGMVAAIAAAEQSRIMGLSTNITVYEKQERVGKKLLATGNGCCNLANSSLELSNYHGKDTAFAKTALSLYNLPHTLDFFQKLGLLTKEEENGKIYPYSRQAAAVLDVLRFRTEALGIKTACGYAVKHLKPQNNGFLLTAESGLQTLQFFAHKVVLATGGLAAPKLGGSAQAYELALQLGHTNTPLFPALVQIKTENTFTKPLKGIKANAKASVWQNNALLAEHHGEILFTEYGVSGPPIFDLSRLISEHYTQNRKPVLTLALDLMPEYREETLTEMLNARKSLLQFLSLENFLTGMQNKRLGQTVLKAAKILPLSRPAASLSQTETQRLAHFLKCFALPITGTLPWANAQVTAGGINTEHFDPGTMESKLVKGFYACGEVLDIDGNCGGYNLQWAWSSGLLAGVSAVKGLSTEVK